MAQYKIGTVIVTNSSNIVTGSGTSWLANVVAGDWFKVDDRSPIYQVASVDLDTQITLTINYAEASGEELSYCIVTDFTPILSLPFIFKGDIDWPDIYRKAMTLLDDAYGDHSSKHEAGGNWEISAEDLLGVLAEDQHVKDDEVLAVAVAKSLYDAQSVLAAVTDDNPVAVTINEQQVLGRLTAENIKGLTSAEILSILLASTVAGDLLYFSAANTLARLAKGAANTKLFMNAGDTAEEWASGLKIISFTRSMTAASGDVAYTTAGFKPSTVIIIAGLDGEYSVGLADSASKGCIQGAPTMHQANFRDNVIYCGDGAGASQAAIVKSWDADGITLTWTYTATHAAVTMTGRILFIR